MQRLCEHMTQRVFEYPQRSMRHIGAGMEGKATFLAGDRLQLVCPHGCGVITIKIVGKADEGKRKPKAP